MFKSSQVMAALALPLTLTLGCSKPKHAVQQVNGTVPAPAYPTSSTAAFGLTDQTPSLEFESSLLLWQANASVDAIQKISDASVAYRVLDADRLNHLQQLGLPGLRAQLPSLVANAKQAEAARDDYVRGDAVIKRKLAVMSTWFDDRAKALQAAGAVSAADAQAAAANFPYYCEAKIWELAVDQLALTPAATRPTPLAMCEAYYTKQKLLDRTTPECADAPAGSTKSYLSCLWKQGILKTQLLTSRDVEPHHIPPSDPDQNAIWVCSAQLSYGRYDWITQNEALLEGVVAFVNAPTTDPKVAPNLRAAVLNGGSLQLINLAGYPGAAAAAAAFNNCKFAFNLQKTTLPARQLPTQILAGFEVVGCNTTPAPTALTADVCAFGNRPLSGNQVLPSLNDAAFNGATIDPSNPDSVKDDLASRPAFAAYVAAEDVPPDLSQAVAATNQAVSALNAKIDAAAQDIQDYRSADLVNVLTAATTAASDPAAVQLYTSDFIIDTCRQGNELYVSLTIHHGQTRDGCVDLDGKSCGQAIPAAVWPACGWTVPDDLSQHGGFQPAYDPTQNRVSADLPLTDPEGLGVAFTPASTEVNSLTDADFRGRTLHLDAYANKLDGLLDFFTGNAEIRDQAGNAVIEGSITGQAYENDSERLGDTSVGQSASVLPLPGPRS